ncbi:MAG: helix-turn-helix domain-containing protein [archaeon]|nr:helix-turn-helix domain-containing protein [archaeon]
MRIINKSQHGPMSRFTDANVYWALYTLSDGRKLGRKKLAEESGVGEGSMRRILKLLLDKGMVQVKRTGTTITKTGLSFLGNIPLKVVNVDIGDAVVGCFSQAIMVYGAGSKIENGMQQRDVGIRAGANGCTTIVIRNGILMIPPDWNLDVQRPETARKIRMATNLTEDDALIVGGGSNKNAAIVAALDAAFDLL